MTRKSRARSPQPENRSPELKLGASAEESRLDVGTAAPLPSSTTFPVVGIGASAGGLAAFEAFFSAMPTDTDPGMAFILVQHLAPDHKSILSDLVRRFTRMQVLEVEDGMAVAPNCAYIIPPNRDMAFLGGALQLLEPSAPRGQRLPIDFFFRSLAQDQQERAICIVLSGTGSDGSQGVRAVKGEGGMAMAQNPESTEFDGMPRSAIATGLVDYVLPPAEMPAQLMAYVAHAFGRTPRPPSSPAPQAEQALAKIFVVLRNTTGHDFSRYKRNSILRRVERRMAVHQVEQLDEYVRYLQQTPEEVDALFRDLLIGVTSFFRDREAFAALATQVIPRLFAAKPAGASIRVWVPACSTGEEAYSVAILLQEQVEALRQSYKVQVFATDVDSRAIAQARAGVYPAGVAADVSSERLARYFTQEPEGGDYRIQKSIRDLVVFSEQDVIKDPPFSRLDLISCRNLLIYLGGDLQKGLIPLFHYALSPGGFLFLGSSETVGDCTDLFAALDRASKLYQRRDDLASVNRPPFARLLLPLGDTRAAAVPSGGAQRSGAVPLRELTERALLEHFAPVGALVSEAGDIHFLHGRTGDFLEPSPGEAAMNILKMARDGLRQELSVALHQAATTRQAVHRPGVRMPTTGDVATVDLTIWPVDAGSTAAPGLYLVAFEAVAATEEAAEAGADEAAGNGADARIAALQQELRAKEEYLNATNEELQTANEELKSSIEEMQSVNEELHSTNEELETSKEEMQSVNEELSTVNAELQQKVTDLSRANNDMANLLAGTGIGTIFVDQDLCILRFTPEAAKVVNLIRSDVGRPLGHIVSNLVGYDRMSADVRGVLATLVPIEVDVQTSAGAWYSLRIRPYRTVDNVIEGAVITFVEVTELKRALATARDSEALRRLAVVVRDANDAVAVYDREGRVLAWNPAAELTYGWSEAEALAMNVRELVPEELRANELDVVLQLGRAEVVQPYRTRRVAKAGQVVEVWLTASALVNEAGEVYAVATTERVVPTGNAERGSREGRT